MPRSIVSLRKHFPGLSVSRYGLLAMCLACLAAGAHAQVAYTIVFGPENSAPAAIDGAGRIAGDLAGRAFLWDGASVVDLGTLGGPSSSALALSDNGLVTGGADRADNSRRAFLYGAGELRDIGQLGVSSAGTGVNAAGQVAGTWVDDAGEDHAFLYSGGVARDIGDLGGGPAGYGASTSARAAGINAGGDVVGSSFLPGFSAYRAFLYREGVMRDLGTLGGPSSAAAAINDAGQVAGTSFIDGDVQHAFLFSDGVMADLGSLGGDLSEARALNEAGDVVGYSNRAGDVPGIDFSHAFLYREGSMLDLNSVTERPGLWTVLDAVGINDAGQIAAYACTDFGDCRAVRLDPIPAVPEPRQAVLWLLGLGGLLCARGRCGSAQRSMSMCRMPSSS